jgi:hypothetical protein
VQAHASHDVQQLKRAYAINAFASHFLSDRFATGHIRTPRKELPDHVTPRDIGSLLVSAMHDEENKLGLHVHNLRGDHWVAYGDKIYFEAINQQNRALLDEAMQKSVDDVFSAYESGVVAQDDVVANLIPQPDELNNQGNADVAPLFYWDNASHTLYRRSDVSNPYGRQWTADWWGWTTLIWVHANHPLSVMQQADLMQSPLGAKALQDGLITDKDVMAVMRVK